MSGAAISADIISYTSLSNYDKVNIENKINNLIIKLTKQYKKDGLFGRIIKGDSIEIAIRESTSALRIALILKTFIKSIPLKDSKNNNSLKYYKEHAIRLAVAVENLYIDSKNDRIDGKAIYMSGRAIAKLSTSDKKKVIIKNTMFFCSNDEDTYSKFNIIFSLLDTILSGCSAKQCEVIYLKLLGLSENDISKKLQKTQATINQHSKSGGWYSIEKAVSYFENTIENVN